MTEVRSMIYFSSFRMWQLPQPYSPQSEYKWGQQQPALQPLGKDELCPCMSTEARQQAAAGRGAGGALLLAALAGAPLGWPEGHVRAGQDHWSSSQL